MRPCAPASARAMFGGHGIYADGRIVAIVIDDVLYFKTDAGNRDEFIARELEPFTYSTRTGDRHVMSYHRAPDEALESPAAMAQWLRSALGAALRSGEKSRDGVARLTKRRSRARQD
jgi:DNA transformation protein and related proteins